MQCSEEQDKLQNDILYGEKSNTANPVPGTSADQYPQNEATEFYKPGSSYEAPNKDVAKTPVPGTYPNDDPESEAPEFLKPGSSCEAPDKQIAGASELLDPSNAIIDMNHITSRHFETKSAKKSIWLPKFHSANALKALLKSGTSAEIPKYTTPKGTKYLDGIRILQTIVLTHKYQYEIGYYPEGKNKTRTLTKFAKFVFYQILPKYSETHDAIFILRTAYPIPPSQ